MLPLNGLTLSKAENYIELHCVEIDVTNKRIYWQEFDIGDKITVKSDGVPFIMMGRKVFDCHFGKDRNVKLKEKLRLQREEVVNVCSIGNNFIYYVEIKLHICHNYYYFISVSCEKSSSSFIPSKSACSFLLFLPAVVLQYQLQMTFTAPLGKRFRRDRVLVTTGELVSFL